MNRVRVPSGRHYVRALAVVAAVVLIFAGTRVAGQIARTGWTVVAWNNLGMHCMDADFSVFAILPPYNTIQAQVLDASGRLVKSGSGITLTYEGVADPDGSINTTSAGKTNFWTHVLPLFGVSLPVNVGLTNGNGTYRMPGTGNPPQAMKFDPALNWFIAEGIPITPYDDAGKKNYYPLMKVTARNSTGALASTNIVLPVSDEMDCRACHSSASGDAARPAAGWVVNEPDAQREYRLNILRLHDDRQLGSANYDSALTAKGYSASGLYATAVGGKSILCANCHASEALAGSGISGIAPLTSAIHTLHGRVTDPTSGGTLEANANRTACYRCHPGSETRCLRGAMGNAVAANGTMAIQCQNCHGPMSAVGANTRTGWFDEPTCQACHTGTATSNAGAIRFTSVFDSTGKMRDTGQHDLRDQRRHAQAGTVALPLLLGPRRPAMLRLSRLDARRIRIVAPERQPAKRCAPGTRRDDRGVRDVPHGRRSDADTRRAARHAPGGRRVGLRSSRRRQRKPGTVPGLPRRGLPRNGAVAHVRGADVQHRTRHEAAVPGCAGRLLHVPQRAVQFEQDLQSAASGVERVGLDDRRGECGHPPDRHRPGWQRAGAPDRVAAGQRRRRPLGDDGRRTSRTPGSRAPTPSPTRRGTARSIPTSPP